MCLFSFKFVSGGDGMRNIVIAASSKKLTATLEKMLDVSGMSVCASCTSASEVQSLWSDVGDAVLICATLKDLPSIYLSKIMPDSWDMILLLTSEQPFPYYVSNVIPINLPVTRLELAETVQSVAGSMSSTFASKTTAKGARPKEETELIEKAKRKIMTERGFPEGDAHKLLQRYSMNSGITMVEAAKRFLK